MRKEEADKLEKFNEICPSWIVFGKKNEGFSGMEEKYFTDLKKAVTGRSFQNVLSS